MVRTPGHSPGGIGLFERATGIFLSGDVIYDGPLIGDYPPDRDDYFATMERLRALPVSVVHGGHFPSFGATASARSSTSTAPAGASPAAICHDRRRLLSVLPRAEHPDEADIECLIQGLRLVTPCTQRIDRLIDLLEQIRGGGGQEGTRDQGDLAGFAVQPRAVPARMATS